MNQKVSTSPIALLASLSAPDDEIEFFTGLGKDDRINIDSLRLWASNYHYFSVQQAPLLGYLLTNLEPSDTETLTEVSKALFEEFGSGHAECAHSRLFLYFCEVIGLNVKLLPLPSRHVENVVLDYLQFISDAYKSSVPGFALGAYCFLERSAVQSYPIMLKALRDLSFNPEALTFFSTHVEQEAGHDAGAVRIAERMIVNGDEIRGFTNAIRKGEALWAALWSHFEEIRSTSPKIKSYQNDTY